MSEIVVKKLNEVYMLVNCDDSTSQEICDFFTFYSPGFQFTPQFKLKIWDGKIRLFDMVRRRLYVGLLSHLLKFAGDRGYPVLLHSFPEEESKKDLSDYIKSLDIVIPRDDPVRDYQIEAVNRSINDKRIILHSPTRSGKSLILYCNTRYLLDNGYKRGVLIVPTTNLVRQMYGDFEYYSGRNGWDVEKNCLRIYSGLPKQSDAKLFISTWQTLVKQSKEYAAQFDFILGDECDLFKAKSLTTIMNNLVNADYRIGCTGSLDNKFVHKLILQGLFGPIHKTITTHKLIERGELTKLSIKCIILGYPSEIRKMMRKQTYDNELHFIVSNKVRNEFIKKLVLSLKGNTLVLFQLVDKHGQYLYDIIRDNDSKRKVFFIHGKVDTDEREMVRKIVNEEKDAIMIASYGTFSRGITVPNLHNVVLASPTKSRTRNLQSIGRSLGLGDNKDQATLYDISDDLRVVNAKNPQKYTYVNHTMKHLMERVKIYNEEKFPYKFYNVELTDGYKG